jgi:acyl-CoA dehydrogenase
MTTYRAPLRDMQFALVEVAALDAVAALPGYEDANAEVVEALLEGAAKLAAEVLAPLNQSGDQQGVALQADGVTTANGFAAAYRDFVAGGWNSIAGEPAYDGQGLPALVAAAAFEMWNAANMSFALCPLLTGGAIEALRAHASDVLKHRYLRKLVSGEWTGTMNLTEPQAGSDLASVRSKAVAHEDHYRIFGQKIFITWGEHDMAQNIVHLVLARLPDAPEGTRGISLFVVPKYLVNPDGSLGQRNDLRCLSVEHKMGIHASPTCVMSFGSTLGAVGYLVGEENQGLAHMFTMMNEARLKVGLQGLGIAERAYQQARDFAKERIQGRPLGKKSGERVTIIHHPDVRRMLLTMKAQIEAMRALCYVVSANVDFAHRHPDRKTRSKHQRRVDLLTPVVKGWCTEVAVEIASMGMQVHGGMGYVEETGASQYLRDARIAPIYEGTTGIQASDLVGRKLVADKGAAMGELIEEMREIEQRLGQSDELQLAAVCSAFAGGVDALEQASDAIRGAYAENPALAMAGSVSYLMLVGYVCGAWQMTRAAELAFEHTGADERDSFYRAKLTVAHFYVTQILPKAQGLLQAIQGDQSAALSLAEQWF